MKDLKAETLEEVRRRAESGEADAQTLTGEIYEHGRGVPKDIATAITWYTRAAEQDHPGALASLGYMHAEGIGVQQDFVVALGYYRRAAEQGDAIALFNIGNAYYEGRGVAIDRAEALKWYTECAQLGDSIAQVNVGMMHFRGEGTPYDFAIAMDWLALACMRSKDVSRDVVMEAWHAAYSWLEAKREKRKDAFRVLYLRAFRGAESDLLHIKVLVEATRRLGRLVVLGTPDGESEFRKRWATDFLDESFDQRIEYHAATVDRWRPIAFEQVVRADCIVAHPSPEDGEYPPWIPNKDFDASTPNVYSVPVEDPVTGAGLLRELGWIGAFKKAGSTVLLSEIKTYQQLMRHATTAVHSVGGEMTVFRRGKIELLSPKIGALNKCLGVLVDVKRVVPYLDREVGSPLPWLTLRLETSILQVLGESCDRVDPEMDAFVTSGVSTAPRRLPPDMEPKVISYTNVEDLVVIPYHPIAEVDPTAIPGVLTPEAVKRGCPYCYAVIRSIFFFNRLGSGDTVYGKCQECGRRSTLMGDMLLDV